VAAPPNSGSPVQTLLDAGVIWNVPKDSSSGVGPHVRGWDLGAFMEKTTWPMDSRGAGNVRYGFPVPGDLSADKDDDGEMIAEAPLTSRGRYAEEKSEGEDEDGDSGGALVANRYMLDVVGYRGLQRLEQQQLDCVLFLTAKWCRTCKRMQLPYGRMARLNNENLDEDLVFARGEASGRDGKMLGRTLGVDAVPTFILFRKGKQYGKPLSISKLPSKKLEAAIGYLKAGKEWDDKLFGCDGETQQTKL
jgi:hypothetical protein